MHPHPSILLSLHKSTWWTFWGNILLNRMFFLNIFVYCGLPEILCPVKSDKLGRMNMIWEMKCYTPPNLCGIHCPSTNCTNRWNQWYSCCNKTIWSQQEFKFNKDETLSRHTTSISTIIFRHVGNDLIYHCTKYCNYKVPRSFAVSRHVKEPIRSLIANNNNNNKFI